MAGCVFARDARRSSAHMLLSAFTTSLSMQMQGEKISCFISKQMIEFIYEKFQGIDILPRKIYYALDENGFDIYFKHFTSVFFLSFFLSFILPLFLSFIPSLFLFYASVPKVPEAYVFGLSVSPSVRMSVRPDFCRLRDNSSIT